MILPVMNALESACDEAGTRANRRIYLALTDPLSPVHCQRLDDLLKLKEANKKPGFASRPLSRIRGRCLSTSSVLKPCKR